MSLDNVSTGDPHVSAHNEERAAINNLEDAVGDRIAMPPNPSVGDILRWNGQAWVPSITRLFEGEGSPEGKIAAPIGSRYVDTKAATGAIEWIKRSGIHTSNTGWILSAFSDTGPRSVVGQIAKSPGSNAYTAIIRRSGHWVDAFFDIETPTALGKWNFYTLPVGFRPSFSRYGALTDNKENAGTGTLVTVAGICQIQTTKGSWRDRWNGQWMTDDPWPATLPGVAG